MTDDAARLADDDFNQLKLLFTDPLQTDYEVIRPLVLRGETTTARSQQTGLDRTTIGDKARRFIQHGMLGLLDGRVTAAGRKAHTFPDAVARYMIYLKQLYPPIHDREIGRIVAHKFGCHTNHHTVKRFLARYSLPVQLPLDLTLFHEFEDAYQARWTVVRMYYEGWHAQSIAGCLHLSERHVRRIVATFAEDAFAGLEDQRARPAHHPANQMTLPLLKDILEVQREYPRAGRFRVHGIVQQKRTAAGQSVPSETTVGRAMALNRAFHQAPGPWVTDHPKPEPEPEPKNLRYIPEYPHHYWFIDIRYLVCLAEQWIYSICIIDGYSRQILVGTAAEYQDSVVVLQLLHAALQSFGCPGGIVSDNGSVFTAQQYQAILTALEMGPCYIEKGKPWQNLIEAQFKVQLRLAEVKFERVTSLAAAQAVHSSFMELFNTTPHWAHRHRAEGAHTPMQVLGAAQGRAVDPGELARLFAATAVERMVNRYGYVSVQRFSIYAERGLACHRVAVWIAEGQVRVEYAQTVLAQYHAEVRRPGPQIRKLDEPRLYYTAFRSPQLELWDLDETQWRKVWQRPPGAKRRTRRRAAAAQLAFTGLGVLLVWAGQLVDEVGRTFHVG